jgi:hypothetical protein
MTALSEAREHLRELVAKRANLANDVKALEAERAPSEARATANNKRRTSHPVVIFAANSWTRSTMASLRVEGYSIGTLVDKKPKEVADAVASGGLKVSYGGGYGASYTARGLSTRVRTPDRAHIKAWDRAIAARVRAEAKLSEAKEAEVAAAKATFDAGVKVTFEELVADIAKAAILTAACEVYRKDPRVQASFELTRMTDGQYGSLSIAKRHVDHLAKKVDDGECSICKRLAQEGAAKAERISRITALPRRKFTCPEHNRRVLGYAERTERPEWVKDDDGTQHQVANLPVLYCPVDFRRYLDSRLYEADKAKAAKPVRAPKTKEITFLCPNPECAETVTASVIGNTVTCDICDVEWDVSRVVKVKGPVAA